MRFKIFLLTFFLFSLSREFQNIRMQNSPIYSYHVLFYFVRVLVESTSIYLTCLAADQIDLQNQGLLKHYFPLGPSSGITRQIWLENSKLCYEHETSWKSFLDQLNWFDPKHPIILIHSSQIEGGNFWWNNFSFFILINWSMFDVRPIWIWLGSISISTPKKKRRVCNNGTNWSSICAKYTVLQKEKKSSVLWAIPID